MIKRGAGHDIIGCFFFPILLFLLFLIAVSTVFSVSTGQVHIPFNQSMNVLLHVLTHGRLGSIDGLTEDSYLNIIYQIRMPRVIFALLIGMGLSLCGTIMQAVVQNPLADPYIIGISSGASLGATVAILFGFGASAFFQILAQHSVLLSVQQSHQLQCFCFRALAAGQLQ